MKKLNLYDTDFYAWTVQQASLLRAKRFDELDLENVAEEIESIGFQLRHKLSDAITLLQAAVIIHWTGDATSLSIKTIYQARSHAIDLLEEYPGLLCEMDKIINESWDYAKNIASNKDDENNVLFPVSCPWAAAEMLADHWFPRVKEKF